MATTRYVRPLADLGVSDADSVGRKAAVLGELTRAGFRVPDGFALTVDALARVVGAPADSEDALARLDGATLPDDVTRELADAYADFAGVPVAVRSSGTAEDLAGASYAGQYETVLDVTDWEALVEAVLVCWRSAFSARVGTYQGNRGTGEVAMAVLVQRMVPADAAGVAFSVNPVSGDRGQAVVSAIAGLGEDLVAGRVTPEEWQVDAGTAMRRGGPEEVIDARRAAEVAGLARRVQDHFGEPQDIEWGIAGDELWLLQARPITALPPAPPVPADAVPPGFWIRDGSPEPWRNMRKSLVLPGLNATNRHIFDYSLLDHFEYAEIDGWMYLTTHRLNDPADVRARTERIVSAVSRDEPGRRVEHWHRVARPELDRAVERARDVDLAALSDVELRDRLTELRRLADTALEQHFLASGAASHCWGELGRLCADLLGWTPGQVLRLVTGLPSKTTEPTWMLAELAGMAAARPAVRAALEDATDDVAARLPEIDREFAAAFRDYLRTYGIRTLGADPSEPSLVERPSVVLGLIRDQLAGGFDPAEKTAQLGKDRDAAESEALAGIPAGQRERFERLLARARRAYPVRDDSAYYTNLTRTLVRLAVVEIGRRLADRGGLADADDVFDLDLDEVARALTDGSDRRPAVRRAQEARAAARSRPAPATLGTPPGPPEWATSTGWLDELSEEARAIMRVVLWVGQATTPMATSAGAEDAIHGLGASPGRYTGTARVITSEAEFGRLQVGDVLVCPETTAQWAVLFPSVGALVTNTGGLLSHPAIIAREYGVPAVVATMTATRRIHDGQVVTVDGTSGDVWVADQSTDPTR